MVSPEVLPDKRVTFRFRAPNAKEVTVDRESAAELLAARVERAADHAEAEAEKPEAKTKTKPAPAPKPARAGDPLTDFLHSRQGKALQREVVRGVFGMLKKGL